MKASDRRDVLWIGETPPIALQQHAEAHDLRLWPTPEANTLKAAPSSRAVVIEFSGDDARFIATARRSIERLVDHGMLVLLCHRNASKAEADQFQHLESNVLKTHQIANVYPAYQLWEQIAYRAAIHNPGPGANVTLDLGGLPLSDVERLLLQRAFSDCSELECSVPVQGFSGSRVLIAHPKKSGGPEDCELPKIVKIGPLDDIEQESAVFSQFVRDSVPFNYRPNLVWDRKVTGREYAAIVQDFVEPALPFDQAVKNGNPSVLTASLFDGALGLWRSASISVKDGVLNDQIKSLLQEGLTGTAPDLHQALVRAKLFKWPDSPKLDLIAYQRCQIHCDLHAGNVFVGATSGDCIVIDFQKSKVGPAAFDPAALEVQLVFRSNPKMPLLRSLYSWPVELPRMSRNWVSNAVRAIRIFGLSTETAREAYALGLIFQLIRFAKFTQPSLSNRVRALKLAHAMLRHAVR